MSKRGRRFKRMFSIRNIAIFLCVIAMIICALYLFDIKIPEIKLPEISKLSTTTKQVGEGSNKITIVESKMSSDAIISESDAKKLAIKQFEKLGEKNIKENNIEIQKIDRSKELYYYVTSPENSLEIKEIGGQITRINSVPVNNIQ